jgi:hypothetical protein
VSKIPNQVSALKILSPTQPNIVAILPRGEAIKNFVYSDALDRVAQCANVHVLSVVPSLGIWDQLQGRYDGVFPLEERREKWLVGALRDCLDMAHGRWLWSKAARERWRLRDLEANTRSLRLNRLAQKIVCYPFAHRPGLTLLSSFERTASRTFSRDHIYLEMFSKLQPTLVFNGSHVHSRHAVQVVHAAQSLGIATATFIFSWDNLTSQGRIIPLYDYYLVWSESIRDQLLELYDSIRPEQIFVTGTPQFDFHFRPEFYWSREEFCRRIGANPARPIVLYSTGMANHIAGEPVIVESLADMLTEMTGSGRPQLLVRVYAKGPTGVFDELKRRRRDILFPEIPWEPAWLTPKLDDCFLLTNMLKHAAVGINIASTISLELCMFDKPVINIDYLAPGVKYVFDYRKYYEFEHYRPVVDSGALRLAKSPAELRELIARALKNPLQDSTNRQKLLKRMFGDTLDGQSGRRAAETLLQLAKRSRNGED